MGMSGLLSRVRDRGSHFVVPDFQVADLAAGYEAAMRIAAALFARTKKGKGVHIDVAMKDAAVSLSRLYREPTPLAGNLPRYGVYETSDGRWMTIAALEPKFWTKFCRLIGQPESVSREALETVFRSKPFSEWVAMGAREDVCLFGVEDASGWTPSKRKLPPLGKHTVSILRKLGYTSRQIRELKARRVVA
jgi:crotonobetainyl-CoA:carnitine CoA-transferase CaiB-like acyl-CoA transferase